MRMLKVRLVEAQGSQPLPEGSPFNVPNALSSLRLIGAFALVPIFASHRSFLAGIFLACLGATDWIDGWWARKFHQTTELGAKLDPTADRFVMILGGFGALIDGTVPRVLIMSMLIREIFVSVLVIRRVVSSTPVFRVVLSGKAATCLLLTSFSMFLMLQPLAWSLTYTLAWLLGVTGVALGWISAYTYLSDDGGV